MTITQLIEKQLAEYKEKFGLCSHSGTCQCKKELDFLATSMRLVSTEMAEAVKVEKVPCLGDPEMLLSLEDRFKKSTINLIESKIEQFLK